VGAQIPPAERERVVQQLGEYFAQDHLSLDEYERRVADAYRAADRGALAQLTQDLPSLIPAPVVAQPAPGAPVAGAPGTVPAARVPRVKRLLALMSGVVRRGAWIVPGRLRVAAVMGGVELDLREATLTAPVTEIYAVALMGGIEITVPPNVRLEADGFAIMGGFEDQLHNAASLDPNAPLVRVRGLAIMGGVEARVLAVGEEERKD
jgi:hypothetical protein